MASPIVFYHTTASPPSRAVWMTLEELGLEYKIQQMDLLGRKNFTEEFRKISIRQKVPAITDGELTIAESRAICAYLVSKYGPKRKKQDLYPTDVNKRAVVDQHLYISQSLFDQIAESLNIKPILLCGATEQGENTDKQREALAVMEEALSRHTYTAADHLTIADICYYTNLGLLDSCGFNSWNEYPKIAEWRKKMEALPYHRKTCEEPTVGLRELFYKTLKENRGKKEQSTYI